LTAILKHKIDDKTNRKMLSFTWKGGVGC
jgi:hypothetical protein